MAPLNGRGEQGHSLVQRPELQWPWSKPIWEFAENPELVPNPGFSHVRLAVLQIANGLPCFIPESYGEFLAGPGVPIIIATFRTPGAASPRKFVSGDAPGGIRKIPAGHTAALTLTSRRLSLADHREAG